MGHRAFHSVREIVGIGWPLGAIGLAIFTIPSMALQAGETGRADRAPEETTSQVNLGSVAFDQRLSLVTANVVVAGQLAESSSRRTNIGGQGWHLVYAGQR